MFVTSVFMNREMVNAVGLGLSIADLVAGQFQKTPCGVPCMVVQQLAFGCWEVIATYGTGVRVLQVSFILLARRAYPQEGKDCDPLGDLETHLLKVEKTGNRGCREIKIGRRKLASLVSILGQQLAGEEVRFFPDEELTGTIAIVQTADGLVLRTSGRGEISPAQDQDVVVEQFHFNGLAALAQAWSLAKLQLALTRQERELAQVLDQAEGVSCS